MFNCVLLASAPPFEATCFLLLFAAAVIGRLIYKAYQESELRRQDPQAYVRLKEIEDQKEKRKHESKMAGMKLGQTIGRWFFGGH
jgi:hypothetical protein